MLAFNCVLKNMIQKLYGAHKTNWHIILFSTLLKYQMSSKTPTSFTNFQLLYGVEATLLVECKLPSLKLDIQIYLTPLKMMNVLYTYHSLTRPTIILNFPMRLIRNVLKDTTISLLDPIYFHKEIGFCYMINVLTS